MIHLAALTTKWEHFLKSWVNFNQASHCEPRNQQLCCETTSRWWTILSLLVHDRTPHYLTFQAWNAHVSKGKKSFTYENGNHRSEVSHEIIYILKTTTFAFVHKTNSYVNIMVHIIRIGSNKEHEKVLPIPPTCFCFLTTTDSKCWCAIMRSEKTHTLACNEFFGMQRITDAAARSDAMSDGCWYAIVQPEKTHTLACNTFFGVE